MYMLFYYFQTENQRCFYSRLAFKIRKFNKGKMLFDVCKFQVSKVFRLFEYCEIQKIFEPTSVFFT